LETIQKVDALLAEKGKKKLGFKNGCLPDAQWLYQVARLVDPCNAADIFLYSVRSPADSKVDSNRVLAAQQGAEKALLGDHGLLGKRDVMDSLEELHNAHKQLKSHEREISLLDQKRSQLVEKVKIGKLEVENRLSAASVLVLSAVEKKEVKLEGGEEESRNLKKVRDV
jgi:hypothetical protein